MRNVRWPILVILIAIVLGAIFLIPRPARTPRDVVLRAADCIRARDADCLSSFASEVEMANYGVNRKQVLRLLADYLFPVLKPGSGPIPTGDLIQEEPGKSSAEIQLVTVDNKTLDFGILGANTGDGVALPDLITNTLLFTANAKHLQIANGPGDKTAKLEAWAKAADIDGPNLTRLGFRGIFREKSEGLLTWSAWADNCRARAAQLRAMASKP